MRQEMIRQGKTLLNAFLDILFPPRCHNCKDFIPDAGKIHLCARCSGEMNIVSSPLCPTCGMPFATADGIDHACSGCLGTRPPWSAARAAVTYEGPARELIHRFKYDKKVQLSRPLGLLVAANLLDFCLAVAPDLIIPVPLHLKRLRQRGFNQSVLLAGVMSREWRLPVMRDNLRRVRWTEPQTELSAAERAENVRGAFSVKEPALISGRRILLVDDVFTTGSTMGECARTLRRAGAGEVFAVSVARAVSI